MYDLRFTADAVSDIKRLPKNIRNSLRGKLEKTVQKDPSRCSQLLAEPLAGFRSFHFGNYRVVFRVYEDLKAIAVVGVGAKSGDRHAEIYKRLENLANTGKLADFVLRPAAFSRGKNSSAAIPRHTVQEPSIPQRGKGAQIPDFGTRAPFQDVVRADWRRSKPHRALRSFLWMWVSRA